MYGNPKLTLSLPVSLVVWFVAAGGLLPLRAQTICQQGSTPPCVLTSQYGSPLFDNQRQSHNANETILSSQSLAASNPRPASFSPLLVEAGPGGTSNPVNPIYAQPLYVAGMSVAPKYAQNCKNINGNACNMLVAVTLYGSIWAWNADTGAVIWNRTGKTAGGLQNYLWYQDCGQSGSVVTPEASVPFAGIVSTPVIDTSTPNPVMFVTSVCQTGGTSPAKEWFLHEINLKNGQDVGTPVQITNVLPSGGNADPDAEPDATAVQFQGQMQLQRSALLEVRLAGSKPNPAVYVAFGSAVPETQHPYHGWIFTYGTASGGVNPTPSMAFNATPTGPDGNTGTPACTTGCTCTPSCTPSCVLPGYQDAPNWCGHAGGVWMASRGGAASTLTTGTSQAAHAFFATGNGSFQLNAQQTGVLNWSESILDFQSPVGGRLITRPTNYFTPQGGPNLPFTGPMLVDTNCGTSPDPRCPATFEALNQYDWDMSTSGITLFQDDSQNNWLVTIDKSGVGYLLPQANLGGFNVNDPQSWQFQAPTTPCWVFNGPNRPDIRGGSAAKCHRITSMSLYRDTDNAANPYYLYYWPFEETLTRLKFSNNTPITPPVGTISTDAGDPSGLTIAGDDTEFTNWLVAGDQINANGQQATVTAVLSDTSLQINQAFNPALPDGTSFTYQGYFVEPLRDQSLDQNTTAYPGGSVVVTSNNGSGGVVWAAATLVTDPDAKPCATTTAMLNAYDAGTLDEIWSSYDPVSETCDGGCFTIVSPSTSCQPAGATFALPTISNGSVYLPTYSFTASGKSGILVFCGNGSAACAAH